MTIDLRTGQQLDCFSTLSENATDNCVCENEQLLDDMENRSRTNSDILFVGRTDYRLIIHSPPSSSVYSASTDTPNTGDRRAGLQEISYSTYTPNSFDKPLAEFWSKSNQIPLEDDGSEVHSTRVELGHDGVAVGVENGGDVKWIKDLGSIGIGVYDILLPMTPLSAKPIIVPQPPPRLEALFPLPTNPGQEHFDIHSKSPSTYIGSVPYQLTLSANDSDQTRPPVTSNSDKPLLYALSSSSYPLINFAPAAKPGSQANGSFPLSEDLPAKDQLLPYLLDPAIDEKTIDPAPESIMGGLRRRETVGRSWIFWVMGVLITLVMAGVAIAGLGQRKTYKQTATPPNEKEPLMGDPEPSSAELGPPLPITEKPELEDSGSPEAKVKTKKKNNARRRVRGGKKRKGEAEDDDDKPLPELPRAISTTDDKERLDISDNVIGTSTV
jgi:serine/threonine-protein kinase/endoribonuclease IRE1